MEKQWYASFVHARSEKSKIQLTSAASGSRVSRPFFGWVSILMLMVSSSFFDQSYADETPSPRAEATPLATSGAEIDPEFLQLPAFDVQFAGAAAGAPIKVGDSLSLKVVGIQNSGSRQSPKDLTSKDLILDAGPSGKTLEDEGWNLEVTSSEHQSVPSEYFFTATPLRPGDLSLPSLALKDGNGKRVARTNPIQLKIESAIKSDDPKPQEPEGLQGPMSLGFPWWMVVMIGILLLGVLGAFIYGIYRMIQKRRASRPKSIEPPRAEDEIALSKLDDVEHQGHLKKGEFKTHYFKVSEILKSYVGSRYRFDALESTTREMIGILDEKKLTSDTHIDQLESLFEKLDRVKFTDHVPNEGEASRLIEEAKTFVRTTRRSPSSTLSANGGVNLNATQ